MGKCRTIQEMLLEHRSTYGENMKLFSISNHMQKQIQDKRQNQRDRYEQQNIIVSKYRAISFASRQKTLRIHSPNRKLCVM